MTRASLNKDTADVANMFDGVAKRYDLLNDVLSLGVVRQWRRDVTEAINPQPDMRILDLAAGTGASSRPLADAGADVYPTDISRGMLDEGKRRYPDLNFTYGNALDLPFDDDFFDACTCSFGLRNVEDTHAALVELRRVTKPGGRLVIAEFSTPTWPPFRHVYQRYITRWLPQLARISPNPDAYTYLFESILTWPDQAGLARLLSDAGWREVAWRNLSGGIVAMHRAQA